MKKGKKTIEGRIPVWMAAFMGAIIFLFILCSLCAKWLAPYDPTKVDLSLTMAAPSVAHPLGCDLLGRDLLSRIIYGAQTVLLTSVSAVLLGCVAGILLGLAAGYFGGVLDAVIVRFTEVILSIPTLVFAMGMAMVFAQSRENLMLVLAFSCTPSFVRIVRDQVRTVRDSSFIQSAYLIGCSEGRVIFRHILPNCVSPVIVAVTTNMGATILAEANLSYLGVGVPLEIPAWGSMVSEGFSYLDTNPMLSVIPSAAIMITVLAFSIFGNWLQDHFSVT